MTRNRLRRVVNVLGLSLLVVAALVTAAVVVPQAVGADHSYVVVSGSMEPTIQTGDVVFVVETPADQVREGDILAFDRRRGDDKRTVHRVVERVERDGQLYFRTKGDGNEDVDPQSVPAGAVIGTVWFWIPYVGIAFSFASTKTGTLALVIVPGVLLAVSEVWTLLRGALAARREDDTGHDSESTAGGDDEIVSDGGPEGESDLEWNGRNAESSEPTTGSPEGDHGGDR